MKLQEFGTGAYVFSRKTIKGLILVAWIGFLIYVAILAATGDISSKLIKLTTTEIEHDTKPLNLDNKNLNAYDFLDDYIFNKLNKKLFPDAPILLFLNEVFDNQTQWHELELESETIDPDCTMVYNEWRSRQYNTLFIQADNLLHSLVKQKNNEISTIEIPYSFYPSPFKQIANEKSTINISPIIRQWIADKIDEYILQQKRESLVNTFFLLLVLGAFGSLIFLTRDFIDQETHTILEAYIFRPILGMFLAMGMFILDLLAHSLISSAGVVELRVEPLYLLALAAGLLSEQAYEILNVRAKAILENAKKKVIEQTKDK